MTELSLDFAPNMLQTNLKLLLLMFLIDGTPKSIPLSLTDTVPCLRNQTKLVHAWLQI